MGRQAPAAKYLVETGVDERWQDNDLLKRSVAKVVSERMSESLKRLASRQGVQVKWLTRNVAEIENRLARDNDSQA